VASRIASEAPMPTPSPVALVVSDRPVRSIAKAISWRITGTLDTIVVSFVVTGELTLALSIGAVEVVTKMALYFVHERVWERARFGRTTVPAPEYEI